MKFQHAAAKQPPHLENRFKKTEPVNSGIRLKIRHRITKSILHFLAHEEWNPLDSCRLGAFLC